MKKNFNETTLPELIEVELNSIKQKAQKGSSVIKDNSVHRHILLQENPVAGYGHCRSCDCKGYISKHDGSHECKNCNHHYSRHN